MTDYLTEMKELEQQLTSEAKTVDTSVFDQLLAREISEDTKALIEAKRALYISQNELGDKLNDQITFIRVVIMSYVMNQNDQIIENQNNLNDLIQEFYAQVEWQAQEDSEWREWFASDIFEQSERYFSFAQETSEANAQLAVEHTERLVQTIQEVKTEESSVQLNDNANAYVIFFVTVVLAAIPIYFIGKIVNKMIGGII